MIIPSGFGQVSFVHQGAGIEGDGVCTLGFRNDAGASANSAAEDIGTLWIPVVDQFCVQGITFTSAFVKLGPNDVGPSGEFAFSAIGDQGDDSASPQTCVLLQKTTLLGGRQGRGRMYVPGPPDVLGENDGVWDAGAVAQWQTAIDTFTAAMTSADYVPVLLHTDSLAPTPMTGMIVSTRSATQRRRNRR